MIDLVNKIKEFEMLSMEIDKKYAFVLYRDHCDK